MAEPVAVLTVDKFSGRTEGAQYVSPRPFAYSVYIDDIGAFALVRNSKLRINTASSVCVVVNAILLYDRFVNIVFNLS
jgi:hypothetical protein